MLESLGMTERETQAYRVLVSVPEAGEDEVGELLGWSAATARRALRALTESGLVRRLDGTPPRYAAADPQVALTALIRTRRADLDAAAATAAALGAAYQERMLRASPSRLVEVIEGASAIAARVSKLTSLAQEEVLAFDAPPYVVGEDAASPDEADALARGVRVRAIYAAEALELPWRMDTIKQVTALGEQARVLPRVPLKMLLVDGKDALIPLTASLEGTRDSAALVHRSRLCDALVELFEASWRQAVAVFGPPPRQTPGDELSEEEYALLHLLSSGVKDEVVARQLGLSERTLRRRISDLLDRLGATSRFQAGLQASRRGWL